MSTLAKQSINLPLATSKTACSASHCRDYCATIDHIGADMAHTRPCPSYSWANISHNGTRQLYRARSMLTLQPPYRTLPRTPLAHSRAVLTGEAARLAPHRANLTYTRAMLTIKSFTQSKSYYHECKRATAVRHAAPGKKIPECPYR